MLKFQSLKLKFLRNIIFKYSYKYESKGLMNNINYYVVKILKKLKNFKYNLKSQSFNKFIYCKRNV